MTNVENFRKALREKIRDYLGIFNNFIITLLVVSISIIIIMITTIILVIKMMMMMMLMIRWSEEEWEEADEIACGQVLNVITVLNFLKQYWLSFVMT